ncbi:hypothetical protein A1j_00017 [Klebsiella phage VLCpiA1j]|nr:hypothetical protein A1b_00021 [Klebsiella phage VLCpiA1b]UVX31313.1 hypothetical protein A1j_00017 [Klebsiella phage VLCpiA1j]
MRTAFAKLFYFILVSPIIPVALLCWLFEKLENSKALSAWESWARSLTKKVTGA